MCDPLCRAVLTMQATKKMDADTKNLHDAFLCLVEFNHEVQSQRTYPEYSAHSRSDHRGVSPQKV